MELQSPVDSYHWTFRRVVWATLVLVSVVFGFWLLYRFHQVIFALFFAIIMGTVIRPIVAWLHRRGIPRVLGVTFVYLLLLVIVISFMVLLYPLISEQGTTILAAVPDYYQGLLQWMADNPSLLIVRLGEFLPLAAPSFKPIQQTGQEVLDFAGAVLGYASSAGRVILAAAAVLLLAYHWTLSGPRIIQSLLPLVSKNHREDVSEMILAMETKIGFYIAGQGFLCVVIFAISLIAYLLIGLPNALVLALIAGLLEAVPLIGPLIGAIPAGVIALSIAPSKLVWVVVITLAVQQLESSFLVPRVMRKAVGVNPFISFLSIFAFSSLFGVAGALMAIPIAAVTQLLLNRYVFHPSAMEPEVSTERDLASRLRYEAQDLARGLRKQARLKKEGSAQRVKQIDQVMDEIESITTDLDVLLTQVRPPGAA